MVNFKQLMEIYKFDNFPRNLGRVRWDKESESFKLFQYPVTDFSQFFHDVWDVAKGHQVYTSHNAFFENRMWYKQMTFDVDTDKLGSTLEMALSDMRKLVRYFDGADKLASFSGNGFHFFLRFEERELPIDIQLRYAIKNFQKLLVDRLGLKTVNLSCAEPKRIIRIPGTMHSEDMKEKGIRYCIPVNEELLDKGLEEIMIASKARVINNYIDNTGKQKLSIGKLLKRGDNAVVLEVIDSGDEVSSQNWSGMSELEFKESLAWLLGETLLTKLLSEKPGHKALVYSCIRIYNMRIPLEDAYEIFDRLASLGKWYNGRNVEKRHYSIRKIYDGGYELWVN